MNQCLGDARTVRGATICGVKTGITPGAGACLALVAAPEAMAQVTPLGSQQTLQAAAVCALPPPPPPFAEGALFLSVVLGSDSGAKRFIDSTRLLSYAAAALDNIK